MSNIQFPYLLQPTEGSSFSGFGVQAPPVARVGIRIRPEIPVSEYQNIEAAARRVMGMYTSQILRFVAGQRQNLLNGIVPTTAVTRRFDYGNMTYQNLMGTETIQVTILPELFMKPAPVEPVPGTPWDFLLFEFQSKSGAHLAAQARLEDPNVDKKAPKLISVNGTELVYNHGYVGFEQHDEIPPFIFWCRDQRVLGKEGDNWTSFYVDLREMRQTAIVKIELRAYWHLLSPGHTKGPVKLFAQLLRGGEMKRPDFPNDYDTGDEAGFSNKMYRWENDDASRSKVFELTKGEGQEVEHVLDQEEDINKPFPVELTYKFRGDFFGRLFHDQQAQNISYTDRDR